MIGLLRFGVKAGITGAAVFYTIDEGVWKNSETSSILYDRIRKETGPALEPYIPAFVKKIELPFKIPSLPELPQTGNYVSSLQTTWNKGVLKVFTFIADLPGTGWEHSKQGVHMLFDSISQQLEQNPGDASKSS